jgi:hypothetical protein
MGVLWLQSWGKVDASIVEEIAKEHKLNVEDVAKAYEKMIKELKDEVKK